MSNGQLWDFGCGIINGFCIISQQWLLNLSKPFHCHNFSDKDINFEYKISTHRFNPTYAEFATSCDSKEVDATIIWNNISMTCIHCAIPNWRQKVTVFVSTDWNQKIIEKLKKKKKTLDPTCHVFKRLRIENMTYNDHYTFDGISWTILGHCTFGAFTYHYTFDGISWTILGHYYTIKHSVSIEQFWVIVLFIKNKSHCTIYIFKNYFIIIFLVFSI